ncbi:carboxymuconolactone decarboxylase family protein [Kribbella shirazensis]|uniref:Alkylhydroperoxidase family enzyme n=1 Tax=Kribbella shirazensis TaxID=1105143 RepID=A0A7X6A4W3_9ACTN|nr:alkylhydroperoxidase family enzyme [Kribbella shirazensis]
MAAWLAESMAAAPDREPLQLFRTLAVHPELARSMGRLGALLLQRPRIDPREREIVIARVTASTGAEYEWGVHAVVFGRPLGLTEAQLAATVRGTADDPVWSARERLLIRLADDLQSGLCVSDELWAQLQRLWSDDQLLELIVVVGWYRMISQLLTSLRVELEPWAARFASVDAADVRARSRMP